MLIDKQDDYLTLETKTNLGFSEERVRSVMDTVRELQKEFRVSIERELRRAFAKHAAALSNLIINETKQKMISTEVQTCEWKSMDAIRQLEVRNTNLLKTFSEERQRFSMKERELLEYSQRV